MSGWHHSARDWPDDQRYLNRCLRCEEQFAGPKRAPYCWPHWEEQRQTAEIELQWLEREYGPFVAPKRFIPPLFIFEDRP